MEAQGSGGSIINITTFATFEPDPAFPTSGVARAGRLARVVGRGFLLAAAGFPLAAFGFAACQGAAMGVLTILRPVLVAEVLGQERYGAVSGMMNGLSPGLFS